MPMGCILYARVYRYLYTRVSYIHAWVSALLIRNDRFSQDLKKRISKEKEIRVFDVLY